MLEPLRRVVVLTHLLPETTAQALPELAECAAGIGAELFLPADEAAKHPGYEAWGFRQIDEDEMRAADLCLVLGGDGTILRALGRMLGSGVPTLGINFGTVGFLASLDQRDWRTELAATLVGKYQVVELLTVEARFLGQRFTGVNDVVLSRVEPRRVLHLEYEVSGTFVGDMFCDGMIIASPTGSTAYNLSCDGPLVVWDASVLVLNFIAPHSLGFRPVVLRPDHVDHGAQHVAARRGRDRRRRRYRGPTALRRQSRHRGLRAALLACSCARAATFTATWRRSCSTAPAMLAELAIDDLRPDRPSSPAVLPGPQCDHRRDRRRQDAAGTGDRSPHGTRRVATTSSGRAPTVLWYRPCSRAATRRWRWRASCRAAAARALIVTACCRRPPPWRRRCGGESLLRAAGAGQAAATRAPAQICWTPPLPTSWYRWWPSTAPPTVWRSGSSDDLKETRAAGRDREREMDLLRFQVEEIDAAQLDPEEDERLAQERERLRHADKLLERVGGALTLLSGEDEGGAGDGLRAAQRRVGEAAALDGALEQLASRLEGLTVEVEDVTLALRTYLDELDADPARRDALEVRHDKLQALKRKYGATVADVLVYAAEAAERLAALERSEADEAELVQSLASAQAQALAAAGRLTQARRRLAPAFSQRVEAELRQLAMPHARFEVTLLPRGEGWEALGPRGAEEAELLFSANPGVPPRPLRRRPRAASCRAPCWH